METKDILLDEIQVPDNFVRSESEARKNLDQLMRSIEEVGLIHPIKVIKYKNYYELVAGFRRVLAHRELGREKIRAEIIEEPETEIEKTIISLIENLQRRNLVKREAIDAAVRLYILYGNYKIVADKLGINYDYARDLVGLQDAPEELVRMVGRGKGKISRDKAIGLLKAYPDNPEKVMELAKIYAMPGLAKEERERLFEIIRENPEEKVEIIRKEMTIPRKQYEFLTILPVKYYQRFELACKERDMEPSELAKTIIMDWIDENVE